MGNDNRIKWIDSARGILIILVVIGHIAFFGNSFANTNSYNFVGNLNFALLPYYMPAFFIITGYVSNFNIPFPIFFKKNFLCLVIPNIIIGTILNKWLNLFLNEGLSFSNFLNIDYVQILITGGGWFLTAMFLSKLLFWGYRRYINKNFYWGGALFLSLFILGVILYNNKTLNIWHYQHALILTPFIYLGFLIRRYEYIFKYHLYFLFGGGVFIILMFLMQYLGYRYPFINANPFLPLNSCIMVVPIAIIGTLTIFSISQILPKDKWLISAGKHSLTIYLIHDAIAIFLIKHSLLILDECSSLLYRSFIVLLIIFITIYLCVKIDIFINRYFPAIKGKIIL